MCNIAGYVGKMPAAPILIEMLRREEGFDAGYYTGIATIHEGRIYYRKVLGDLETLLEKTDAASLPGTIGLIHSRTKSGGPQIWSHPFVSAGKYGNEPTVAYVANGGSGVFKDRDPEYNRIAESLIEEGYKLDSEIELEDGIYNRLSNGKMVHMSDVMCALIAKEIDLGCEPCEAMENAFSKMPGEIVGLLLSLKTPDRIAYSKINRPMTVAFAEHGAYLGTTSIAFPSDTVTDTTKLPTLSSGYVTADGFTSTRYKNPPIKVVNADAGVMAKLYKSVYDSLSSGEKHLNSIASDAVSLFGKEKGSIPAFAPAKYEILESMMRDGKIEIIRDTVEGEEPGSRVPYFKIKLK